jgi:hypothetical protein
MRVILDHRQGVTNLDQHHSAADATDATRFVSMLDGLVHTLAYFERDDGVSLMVGGGQKHFVVTLTDDAENLTLANENAVKGGSIEVCAGGQFGEYPSEAVCNIDQAITAVTKFFDGLEADLDWR